MLANASVKGSSSSEQQQSVDALIHGSRPSVWSDKEPQATPTQVSQSKIQGSKVGVRSQAGDSVKTGVRAITREPFPLIFPVSSTDCLSL